jgi:putative transposase
LSLGYQTIMKSNTLPIKPETWYHIYNRGVNGCDIFSNKQNYNYFLRKYSNYIPLVAETYAYCLLKNHFHLLIKTKTEEEILKSFSNKPEKKAEFLISKQFSHLFNSYAQAFNKQQDRTGLLFETPFRRKEIDTDSYFATLIFYIHANAQKHHVSNDFRKWEFSSYQTYLSNKPTKLNRVAGLEWFDGLKNFIAFHDSMEIDMPKDHDVFMDESH